jgi:predicted Ser/Thr protein kinase
MNDPVYIGLYKLDKNGFLGEGSFSTVHMATSCRYKSHKVAIKIDKNPGINSVKHEATILAYLNKMLPNVMHLLK